MLIGMMVAHLVYIFFFSAVRSYFMAFFNVFSLAFYIILFIVFLNRKYLGVMIFLFIEVCVHSFFASVVIGYNSGFELFIICVVFSTFHVKKITQATRKVIYALIAFAFITLVTMRFIPNIPELTVLRVYPSEGYLSFIFLFNAIMAFTMVSFFLIIFLDDVELDNEILKRRNARLMELARIDSLTGLLNRRAMKKRLEDAFQSKLSYGVDFVVAIVDMDNFKQINDQYGHVIGDQMLKRVASIIHKKVRETDYVCRWGGDEIMILFNKSSVEGAVSIAKRIHAEICGTKMHYDQNTLEVTVTIGMSSSENHYLLQDILMEADRRLYSGKRAGKSLIVHTGIEPQTL